MRRRRSVKLLDVVTLLLVVGMAVVATAEGIREGNALVDADERVFQVTLHRMRAGDDYYHAMRDALVAKERRPPSEVRAIRPPTEFLFLRLFPVNWWRRVVGLVYLAVLLAAWRLGRPWGRYGGVLAVVGAGVWLFAFTDFLYLHAELWGLPFLMWGLVALRRDADWWAAAALLLATAVREPYALAFAVAFLIRRGWRRAPWLAAAGALAGLAVVHVHLARQVLAGHGHEAKFGNEAHTLRFALRVVSPGTGGINFAFGVAMLVLGLGGLVVAARRRDPAAWVALPFVLFMVPAAEVATRIYWSAAWAVPAAAFAPAVLSLGRRGAKPQISA
jgi:hypothetical protein